MSAPRAPLRQFVTCGGCLFFAAIKNSEGYGLGECRARAPVADPFDRDHPAVWPVVNIRQGCGSGARKGEKP